MKAFVVGASGYIGAALYAAAGKLFDVYGTTSDRSRTTQRILALQLDRPEEFDYEKIGARDMVFLTAAISAPDICAREQDRARAVNVTGTGTFISRVIARGARVIFFSSDTVYGEQAAPFDETGACTPAGEYAEMKHEIESRFQGMPLFKAIRLSYVFSKDDKFTKYLAGCVARGEEAEIFHPFYRSVIHRDDVVEGALGLALRWDEFPQQVINFGGPAVLSRVEFAETMRETVLPLLQLRVTEPGPEFFRNRPRIIAMRSAVLPELLGRSTHTLAEAATMEFSAN